jgi:hypothetical protein
MKVRNSANCLMLFAFAIAAIIPLTLRADDRNTHWLELAGEPSVTVKKEPTRFAADLGTFERGYKLRWTTREGDWYRVLVDDTVGYVYVDYAKEIEVGEMRETRPSPKPLIDNAGHRKAEEIEPAIDSQMLPVTIEGPATVLDTARLQVGASHIRIWGIAGYRGQFSDQLQSFIHEQGGGVKCQRKTTTQYICRTASGVDVAEAALANGAARTAEESPDRYRQYERDARVHGRGIWNPDYKTKR